MMKIFSLRRKPQNIFRDNRELMCIYCVPVRGQDTFKIYQRV